MSRTFSKIRITPTIASPSIRPRRFHVSTPHSSAITLPLLNVPDALPFSSIATSSNSAQDLLRQQKYHDLEDSVGRDFPNPSRVWSYYTDLLSYLEFEHLPLEIHQSVLRKCVPSTNVLRGAMARRMAAGNAPRIPHMFEARLKSVMRNIRTTGHKPTLSDYHFILEQFASVGHYKGAFQVYNELTLVFGLHPTPKTYGLCLQAIAHRLSLPIYKFERKRLVEEAGRMCQELMKGVAAYKLPFTSVNLDLTIRVLKEIADEENFSRLMKVGYGIDLDNPDHPPLDVATSAEGVEGLDYRVPFSTAALNTTLDMLGRFGNVPKLVQAFEVLTQPLPPQANKHFSMAFDEEDDFGVINPASTQPYQAPHATPNTTTYNILLKHISRAGHATFARHYLFQAMRLDRQTDRDLRSQMRDSHGEVLAPHFTINKGTILPVFGEANRDKNLQLMRWVAWVARQTIRRKKNDIVFYSQVRQDLQEQAVEEASSTASELPTSSSVAQSLGEIPIVATDKSTNTASNSSPSSSISFGSPLESAIEPQQVPKKVALSSALEVDIDAPWTPSPAPIKYFNLDLHLSILQRDLEQITAFNQHIELIMSRTTQRVKERLGRRVWSGKDVYLRDSGERSPIARKTWGDIVNFQRPSPGMRRAQIMSSRNTQKGNGRRIARYSKPGWLASQQGLAMSLYADRLES